MKKRHILVMVLALICIGSAQSVATAQQSSSSNFRVNEVFFGSGGELKACSGSYCSKQSAGELTVGNTSSSNYQAQAGFNTNREPWIGMQVLTPATSANDVLSFSQARYATAQFRVSAYLGSGYVVQTWGNGGMKNGSRLLANLTTPSASSPGTEQFGINLVANTSPTTLGGNPTQSPDYVSQPFGFGQAASGYSTPNMYKYVDGDTIARSTKSTTYTDYTISYLFNITPITPGGTYTMNQSLVATATF
ncbi:MAG: hypothetical protein QG629_405 [Patescibacteria group bacterium]|nr:hypothetical protein [Candidatus Saccharibacteria bacterium]MDQ5963323.1 hypothetical protein [Patescibacteria group bacterium]